MLDIPVPDTRCEWSYLAGLIDGEGSVNFYKNTHGSGYIFIIDIWMTDEATIDWLHENFDGKKYSRGKRRIHWKPLWRWRVQGDAAIALYLKIYPFLRIKRVYDLEPSVMVSSDNITDALTTGS
jgi:hypothetical protein